MINYYKTNGQQFVTCSRDDPALYWIELIHPTDKDAKMLARRYHFPLDYLSDLKDTEEISRIENIESEQKASLFMFLYPYKVLGDKEWCYSTRAMSIIQVGGIVITAVEEPISIQPEEHISSKEPLDIYQKTENFILEIAWRISQKFILAVEDINRRIDDVEQKIRTSSKTDDYYQIISIKKSLIAMELAIRENGPIMSQLYETEKIFNSEPSQEMLHDLQVEYKQANIMIAKSTKIVEQLGDLYSAMISNNLNEMMKVLTSITIVLTVPTIVGGLWGMNMKLPMADNPWAFVILVALTIVICVAIIMWLRKRDFL